MTHHTAALRELCTLMTSVKDPDDMKKFLQDLLTPQELEDVVQRLQVVKMLAKGETQRNIAKKLGVSIALVTRGSTMLHYGTGEFLKRLGSR